MIRHVVMFSAKDAKDIDAIEQGLKLLSGIEEALHFEVARNLQCDQIANEISLVVYAEFADVEALQRYKQHPLYAQAIQIVRPLRDIRVAADFLSQ